MYNHVKNAFNIFILACISTSLTACSFFAGWNDTLNVAASEPDANIFINGGFKGKGHVSVSVPSRKDVSIMVTHPGFCPETREIPSVLSTVGVVDVIGGVVWLVPFLGLISPGAWRLDQTSISIPLVKEGMCVPHNQEI
ncbi:MAG: hypothetical protein FWF01_02810 [Alphaproteobacteria bacterium]|nr:hypothetical protein [Alphaproteobacteria bacterium]